jgi:hypothetical protein
VGFSTVLEDMEAALFLDPPPKLYIGIDISQNFSLHASFEILKFKQLSKF